jgi:hypothetical protein
MTVDLESSPPICEYYKVGSGGTWGGVSVTCYVTLKVFTQKPTNGNGFNVIAIRNNQQPSKINPQSTYPGVSLLWSWGRSCGCSCGRGVHGFSNGLRSIGKSKVGPTIAPAHPVTSAAPQQRPSSAPAAQQQRRSSTTQPTPQPPRNHNCPCRYNSFFAARWNYDRRFLGSRVLGWAGCCWGVAGALSSICWGVAGALLGCQMAAGALLGRPYLSLFGIPPRGPGLAPGDPLGYPPRVSPG